MKNSIQLQPFTDWKVLFYSPKDAPLGKVVNSTPGLPDFVTVFHDFHKATSELLKEKYSVVMSDVSHHDPLAHQLITWLHINRPDIQVYFLGTSCHQIGEIDVWTLADGNVFSHSNIGIDPLTEPLSILYSEEVPLKWLQHARCECFQARKRLDLKKNNVVLLVGACGSGKAAFAQISHFTGPRKDSMFVFADCNQRETKSSVVWDADAENRFRKSLRHVLARGARGTVYIHDVDVLNCKAQTILNEEIRKVTESQHHGRIPRLIICATKKHLEEEVGAGDFSEELFSTINDNIVTLPSLYQYKDELPLIAENLLRTYCISQKLQEKKFSKESLEEIRLHTWDQNIRGLFRTMKQGHMMSDSALIKPEHLNIVPRLDSHNALIDQSHSIKSALKKHKGMVARAAKELNVSRSHLYKLMMDFDIPRGYGLPPVKRKKMEERQKKRQETVDANK